VAIGVLHWKRKELRVIACKDHHEIHSSFYGALAGFLESSNNQGLMLFMLIFRQLN